MWHPRWYLNVILIQTCVDANDVALIACNRQSLTQALDELNTMIKQQGPNINYHKTKYRVSFQNQRQDDHLSNLEISVICITFEQVRVFIHLGAELYV